MTRVLLVLMVVFAASPALAQSYVAASVGADLTKTYESTTNGAKYPAGDGEAVSWGLRVGTALASRWGVELEFNRPGLTESQSGPIALAGDSTAAGVVAALVGIAPSILPVPRFQTDQRNTTWNAAAWVSHPLGSRADLVFLAGLGFSRVVQHARYSFNGSPERLEVLVPSSFDTRTVSYGVGPLVGAEARIQMTEHAALIPGIRVQSLGNDLSAGLLLRPSVALAWIF